MLLYVCGSREVEKSMWVRSSVTIDSTSALLGVQETKSLQARERGSDDGVCQPVVGPPLLKAEDYRYVVDEDVFGLPNTPATVGDHGDENAQGLVVVVSATRPVPFDCSRESVGTGKLKAAVCRRCQLAYGYIETEHRGAGGSGSVVGSGFVIGIGHDSPHHQQVLADLRGGSAAVVAPHLVCDAAILLHEAAYVIPHHECGLTGECFQCRAKQGYFVQLSHDRLQFSQASRLFCC